jgi:hypothetical protein
MKQNYICPVSFRVESPIPNLSETHQVVSELKCVDKNNFVHRIHKTEFWKLSNLAAPSFRIFFERYSPWWTLASFTVESCSTVKAFYGVGPATPCPTWRARVSHLVRITFDLSGMGDPTRSYTTASIALRIIWPCKPHHYVKVGIPTGGPST